MTEKNTTPKITERLCRLFSGYGAEEISVSPYRISHADASPASFWLKPKASGSSERHFVGGGKVRSSSFELCLLTGAISGAERLRAEALLEDVFAFGEKNAEEYGLSLCEASPVTLEADTSRALFALSFTARYSVVPDEANDSDAQSITIVSGPNVLEISSESPCRALDGGLEGFDFPESIVKHVANALDDGAQITERHFGHRLLAIRFEITEKNAYKDIRDTVLKLMNPHSSVTVVTRFFERSRYVTCTPYKAPEFSSSVPGGNKQVLLHFICEDPFFREESSVKLSLPVTEPMLYFPMTTMKNGGASFSLCEDTYIHTVNNPGDAACGFVATLTAERGTLTQPSVRLGTKRLQYLGTLAQGSSIVFDTRQGSKSISVNGALTYNFDTGCEFFKLEPGDNVLTVASVGDVANMDAQIEFCPNYLGA